MAPSAAPRELTEPQWQAVDRYRVFLLEKMVGVIGPALKNMAPASVKFGQSFAGIAVNRRRAPRPGTVHDGADQLLGRAPAAIASKVQDNRRRAPIGLKEGDRVLLLFWVGERRYGQIGEIVRRAAPRPEHPSRPRCGTVGHTRPVDLDAPAACERHLEPLGPYRREEEDGGPASQLASSAGGAVRPWNRPAALGRSGLAVTALGMGCEDLRDLDLIRQAAGLGINHFHTLSNFEVVGRALRPIRSHVVLGAGSSEQSGPAMLQDLGRQLRSLGTDYIDLWYLTSKYRPEFITDELLESLRSARQAGKIRACGVAGHGLAAIANRLVEIRELITAVMVVCNFATWSVAKSEPAAPPRTSLPGGHGSEIIRLHEAGIGIVAMKPLMGGLRYVPEESQAWANLLTEESRPAALSAALKWVLANRYVDSAPVEISSLDHLQQNTRAAAAAVTDADRALLNGVLARIGPYYCRMCQQCSSACREGLPVSDLLRHLMYTESYGRLRMADRLQKLKRFYSQCVRQFDDVQ